MKKESNFKTMFLVIFSFIVGCLVILIILKWTPILDDVFKTNTEVINKSQIYDKSSLSTSIEKVYDAVMVVNGYQSGQLASTGTAFVYEKDNKYAYLLTNQHVVQDMNTIKLVNTDNETIDAKVLGGDTYLDLAVLRIDAKYAKLKATIGSSEKAKMGDTVFTVGTPLGNTYAGSVTAGIISGKDRMVSVSTSNYNSSDWVMNVIQVDASLNPGNSGGPLLNAKGEVIGICSMKLVDAEIEGMGFAIPIEYAISHYNQLKKGQSIDWPVLGIKMTDINASVQYEYKVNTTEGVLVVGVVSKSGADKAGIKEGDIITEVEGNKTEDVAHLRYQLYQHKAGDKIKIKIIRNNKEKTVTVKLNSSKD